MEFYRRPHAGDGAALPALLVLKKFVIPELVIVALPALLPSKKFVVPLLMMVASPAVAVPLGFPKKAGAKLSSPPGTIVMVA